jgi:hypothetical protein
LFFDVGDGTSSDLLISSYDTYNTFSTETGLTENKYVKSSCTNEVDVSTCDIDNLYSGRAVETKLKVEGEVIESATLSNGDKYIYVEDDLIYLPKIDSLSTLSNFTFASSDSGEYSSDIPRLSEITPTTTKVLTATYSPTTNLITVDLEEASSVSVSFVNLPSNTDYKVYTDSSLGTGISGLNCDSGICESNSSGELSFDYSGDSDITFTINPDFIPPSVQSLRVDPKISKENDQVLYGTVGDTQGLISLVQYQVDTTDSSWSDCSAVDGAFDELNEEFSCSLGTDLSDGVHTVYLRTSDSYNNTTSSSDYTTTEFTVDKTKPKEFDLRYPEDESYTSNSRQIFSWKKTTDATTEVSKYQVLLNGDVFIDSIDPEDSGISNNHTRTDSTKYIKYGKDYIEVNTIDEGNELPNGKMTWKVRAIDSAGNIRSTESRVLYVDLEKPPVQLNSIADRSNLAITTTSSSGQVFITTHQTPTFRGTGNPENYVKVEISSQEPLSCETFVKQDGSWECTFDNIPYGKYSAKIVSTNKAGKSSTLPEFYFFISSNRLDTTLLEKHEPTEEDLFTTPWVTNPDSFVDNTKLENYDVLVKVVDVNNLPLKNVKVTLFSKPREALTDDKGTVVFKNVSGGEHRVVVEQNNQIGDQLITLSGKDRQLDFTVRLGVESSSSRNWFNIKLGIFALLIPTLAVLTVIKAKIKNY